MNATDAMEIINAICDKIGIVYDKAIGLVPYIVRYNIASDVATIFVMLIVAFIGWRMWHKGNTLTREDMKRNNQSWSWCADDHLGWLLGGVIALFVGVLVTFIVGVDLIQWIFAPEISSLKWAMELVK